MGAFEFSIPFSFPLSGLSRVPAMLEPRSPTALTHNGPQVSNSNQVVGRGPEGEHSSEAFPVSMSSLARQPDGLDPTKDLSHPLPLSLTHRVARMLCGATVNRARSMLVVLRHMRRDVQLQLFELASISGFEELYPAPFILKIWPQQSILLWGLIGPRQLQILPLDASLSILNTSREPTSLIPERSASC